MRTPLEATPPRCECGAPFVAELPDPIDGYQYVPKVGDIILCWRCGRAYWVRTLVRIMDRVAAELELANLADFSRQEYETVLFSRQQLLQVRLDRRIEYFTKEKENGEE